MFKLTDSRKTKNCLRIQFHYRDGFSESFLDIDDSRSYYFELLELYLINRSLTNYPYSEGLKTQTLKEIDEIFMSHNKLPNHIVKIGYSILYTYLDEITQMNFFHYNERGEIIEGNLELDLNALIDKLKEI